MFCKLWSRLGKVSMVRLISNFKWYRCIIKALPGSLLILSEIYLRPNLIVPIPTLLNTTQYIIHYIIYYCRPLPPDRYRALQSKQGKNYYDGFSTTPSSILTYGFVPLKTIRPLSSSLLVHTDPFSPITVWFIYSHEGIFW